MFVPYEVTVDIHKTVLEIEIYFYQSYALFWSIAMQYGTLICLSFTVIPLQLTMCAL